MNRFAKLSAALALCTAFAVIPEAEAETDEIIFYANVDESRDGKVLCGLYDDEDTWLTRDVAVGVRSRVGDKSIVTCTFENIEPGTYGIAAIHDEDGDEEMDKNLIGIPEEGYAASRNAHLDGLIPDWEDARFDYRGGHIVQRGEMKY